MVLYVLKNSLNVLVWSSLETPLSIFAFCISFGRTAATDIVTSIFFRFHNYNMWFLSRCLNLTRYLLVFKVINQKLSGSVEIKGWIYWPASHQQSCLVYHSICKYFRWIWKQTSYHDQLYDPPKMPSECLEGTEYKYKAKISLRA